MLTPFRQFRSRFCLRLTESKIYRRKTRAGRGDGDMQGLRKTLVAAGIVGLIASSSQLMTIPAWAEYLVERGDVLEITVSGSADLHRRAMVNDDGKLSFPLLGDVSVAGRSLSQLRVQLHDLLVAKKLLPDPDVIVEISEYRPVYVSGDVTNSGAYPYRPGITVRDAVALAGGYDSSHLRSRDHDALVQAIDARDQYDSLSIELVKIEVHIARLQAELSNQADIDLGHVQIGRVAREAVSELAKIEGQQLKIDRDDYDKEQLYLDRMVKVTQEQVSVLSQEEQQERSGLEQQRKDAARARELLQKSLVPMARVEEQAREISESQARSLETKAKVSQTERELEEFTRRSQKHEDQHKIDVMQQLQKSMGELATVRVRLDSAGEKLRYLDMAKQQSWNRSDELRDLVILRKAPGDSQRIVATEETSLLPGDTLEITGRATLDQLVGAPVIAGAPAANTGRLAP